MRTIPFRVADAGPIRLAAPIGKKIRFNRTANKILGPDNRLRIPAGKVAIVISPGPRSSTGYSVRVLSVVEERRRIVVRVREETPTLQARVEPRVTYPYRVILIDDTHKRVVVRWQGR